MSDDPAFDKWDATTQSALQRLEARRVALKAQLDEAEAEFRASVQAAWAEWVGEDKNARASRRRPAQRIG